MTKDWILLESQRIPDDCAVMVFLCMITNEANRTSPTQMSRTVDDGERLTAVFCQLVLRVQTSNVTTS